MEGPDTPVAPIAAIGLACRFPAAPSPEAFWALLRDGVDAITEVPRERWDVDAFYDPDPDAPGRMSTRHGSFLPGVDRFDAEFFGITPKEAARMDPQHRLLLEVAWEAFETAGLDPRGLAGSPTGVFVGLCHHDYLNLILKRGDPALIDAYVGVGNSGSVAAGRISYVLGLEGPSLVVDTACSSSLVAVHLACQSLLAGESRLALAGGVNLMLGPEATIDFSKARMMAPDGRCKTFDAKADGYVRGEGCGAVVLKRLADALMDGDPVLAVIRGTAVNQDGRSNGLTAPNGLAQRAVIRQALRRAGLDPLRVGYLEAHGTGTSLGDPIEMRAIGEALCEDRPKDQPLVVGSVKTNLGHLEAAAGMAGLAKAVLALRHREIPRHLHFEQPSPYVEWDRLPVVVPAASRPWPASEGAPRVAGVSSFGFSGTNAHVVLEEAPRPASPADDGGPRLLVLSARSEAALRRLAGRYAAHLDTAGDPLRDVAFTAAVGRAHQRQRAALVASRPDDAARTLRAFAEGGEAAGLAAGRAGRSAPRPVFLFSGQGSAYRGMGRELFEREPVFRRTLERCDAGVREHLPQGLLHVLYDEGRDGEPLVETAAVQPALFSLQAALVELWRAAGVEPAAVLGHSVGEYAAAFAAGVFSLEDGLRLVARRGALMGSLSEPGGMLAVRADEATVAGCLAPFGDALGLAVLNHEDETVVSGRPAALDALAAAFQTRGVSSTRLLVSHAFHSALLDPMLDPLEREAAAIPQSAPRIPFVSNLDGRPLAAAPDGAYWRRQTRSAVRFADGVRGLLEAGRDLFVEVGPGTTLLGLGQRAPGAERAAWLPSLRRGRSDAATFLEALGALHVRGARVSWEAVFAGASGRRRVALPTYPWEGETHWFEDEAGPRAPRAVQERLQGEMAAALGPLRAPAYASFMDALDQVCALYVSRALREMGFRAEAGDRASRDALAASLGIAPRHLRLFGRLLEILAEDGVLAADASGAIEVLRPPAEGDGDRALDALLERFPATRAELALVRRSARSLAGVLRGEIEARDVLFPGGALSEALALYQDSPAGRALNAILGAAVRDAVSAMPPSRPVRVLEVGAGTGSATGAILPVLPAERAEYVFTDVSPFFTTQAQARFGGFPFVRYDMLDVGRDPRGQGYEPASFDLVVAANVLHATKDLEQTLRNVEALLAPRGLLVVLEGTRPQRWLDLVFGLTDGWWEFADFTRRPRYPLLDPAAWDRILRDVGFDETAVLPADAGDHFPYQAVILARAPRKARAQASPSAAPAPKDAAREPAPAPLLNELEAAVPGEREALLVRRLQDAVLAVSGQEGGRRPDPTEGFFQLGLDSLMALQLQKRLEAALGRPLPATLTFEQPSIHAMARYLVVDLLGLGPEPAAAGPAAVNEPAQSEAETEQALLRELEKLEY
jgi:acyl transferase domain-containing protein/SAM-dependent methyltransferase